VWRLDADLAQASTEKRRQTVALNITQETSSDRQGSGLLKQWTPHPVRGDALPRESGWG